jgi:hypothetical protein
VGSDRDMLWHRTGINNSEEEDLKVVEHLGGKAVRGKTQLQIELSWEFCKALPSGH